MWGRDAAPSRRTPSPVPSPAGGCVVCFATHGMAVLRHGGFALVQCRCGAMFLEPRPAADAVDPTIDLHPDSFYALPAARKVRWLARSKASGRLLEVGCGRGHFLAAARAHGYAVAGIEAHAQRARTVAAALAGEIEAALLEESCWPDATCDVVYHCDLLSHFPDPLAALLRMRRLLRPGGVMFFEVGLVGGLAPWWYRWMPAPSLPRHRWFYDEPSLRLLLARAGLRVERLQRFGLGPQVVFYRTASLVLRQVRTLLGTRARPAAPPPASPPRERPGEGRWNDWLRFGIGRIVPWCGPQTAFVLARPVGGEEA